MRRPARAFVMLTHDHALDFLIVAEALKRERRRLCRHDRLEDQEGDVQELVPEVGGRHAKRICPPRLADRRRRGQGQAPAGHRRARGRRDHDGAGKRFIVGGPSNTSRHEAAVG